MAITKVGAMTDPPGAEDYTILQAKLDAYAKQIGNQGMILTEWVNTTTTPAIALGSYITHGGTLFVVDTEDYAVPAPAGDGTFYLKVSANGDTLSVVWTGNLAGYTWNAIYNGLYHSDESQILPYQLVKAGATLTKRKITNLMQGSGFVTVDWTGAVIGQALNVASINTGSGAMTFDQGVKTTDSPTFNILKVNTITLQNSYLAGDVDYIKNELVNPEVVGTLGEVIVLTYQIKTSGIFRFKTNIRAYSSTGTNPVTTEKIYVNDIVIATNVTTTQNTIEAKINDISLQVGDTVKISIACSVAGTTSWCYLEKPTKVCVSALDTTYLGYSIRSVEQEIFGAITY